MLVPSAGALLPRGIRPCDIVDTSYVSISDGIYERRRNGRHFLLSSWSHLCTCWNMASRTSVSLFLHPCRLLQACIVKYDAVAEVVAIMRCNGIAGFLWCIHITTRLCEDVVMRMLRKIV